MSISLLPKKQRWGQRNLIPDLNITIKSWKESECSQQDVGQLNYNACIRLQSYSNLRFSNTLIDHGKYLYNNVKCKNRTQKYTYTIISFLFNIHATYFYHRNKHILVLKKDSSRIIRQFCFLNFSIMSMYYFYNWKKYLSWVSN